jgi:hypothetical protein
MVPMFAASIQVAGQSRISSITSSRDVSV